jgi:hypothetical protein
MKNHGDGNIGLNRGLLRTSACGLTAAKGAKIMDVRHMSLPTTPKLEFASPELARGAA